MESHVPSDGQGPTAAMGEGNGKDGRSHLRVDRAKRGSLIPVSMDRRWNRQIVAAGA